MIYYIQAGEYLKIGYTGSPTADGRLAALQTASPLDLRILATEPGEVVDETALHRRFAHLRVRGEWFRFEGELLDHVARVQGAVVLAPRREPIEDLDKATLAELLARLGD
jgi:hypothetical protein